MIYRTPEIAPKLQRRLDTLAALRAELGHEVERPVRWIGSLRRDVRASTIGSSTSIEGYGVAPGEAVSLLSGKTSLDPADENRMAVACYARAMDHVGTMAADPAFRWLDRVILDLHFDACYFQGDKDPGLWRTGPVGVSAPDGSLEYEGPDSDRVPGLMSEVVDWLEHGDVGADPVVRAAMAHLQVTSVHPFRDGNGRVSRIVQSLVLARAGMTSAEFFSIEDYLGAHTADYYSALREVQGGSYQPERDASKWVAFCVEAHVDQAQRRIAQFRQAGARWERLERLVEERGWPDRLVIALERSLMGGTGRTEYGEEADVAAVTASGDFRRLLDAGLVVQRGRGRSTRYEASESLRTDVAEAARR
ncbi:MAG: Fic family protein [Solirubrobacterales bacterium]